MTRAAAPPEVSPSERSALAADPTTEDEDRCVAPFPDGCQPLAASASTAQVSEFVVTRPSSSPAEVEDIDAHEARLAQAARGSSWVLPAADAVAAVEAAMLADAVDRSTWPPTRSPQRGCSSPRGRASATEAHLGCNADRGIVLNDLADIIADRAASQVLREWPWVISVTGPALRVDT
jgi:hypothetical protein